MSENSLSCQLFELDFYMSLKSVLMPLCCVVYVCVVLSVCMCVGGYTSVRKVTETVCLQTEYYERYTQKLQKQIEDQQQLISELEAKLSATKQPPG